MEKELESPIPQPKKNETEIDYKNLSPEGQKMYEDIEKRAEVLKSLFKIRQDDEIFNQALQELTLESTKEHLSGEEKRILGDYKAFIIKLISHYSHRLSPKSKEIFEKLCLGLIK